MQAGYEIVENLIVALGCPRTVNIELLAHSFQEDTSACYRSYLQGSRQHQHGVRAHFGTPCSGRMVDMGFMSFM